MKLGDVVYYLDFIPKFNPQTIFRQIRILLWINL